jgi:hypothetical protein
MDSLNFTPGRALFLSQSLNGRWATVFEDEGASGYLYACDRTLGEDDKGILDAMLVYNGSALEKRERLASVQWSRDGQRAAFYLDGTAQALIDFAARESFCRSNFPNFLDGAAAPWRQSSHAWDDAAFSRFEAELYE